MMSVHWKIYADRKLTKMIVFILLDTY